MLLAAKSKSEAGTKSRSPTSTLRDVQLAVQDADLLLTRGWELVTDTTSEHHWYLELWHNAIDGAMPAMQFEHGPDIAGQLEKLANLHKSGEISDADYQLAKRRVLGY